VAYTFSEAATELAANAPSHVLATLIFEQEDSRTAWGRGNLFLSAGRAKSLTNIGKDLGNAFKMQFSDRTTTSAGSPFSGETDDIEMSITMIGNVLQARIVLKSWGDAEYLVSLKPTPPASAKMLTGWGNEIGDDGTRQALYCISLNEVNTDVR
jgi:hypothetical protein